MGPTGSVHGDAGFGRLEASHGVVYQGVTPLTWHSVGTVGTRPWWAWGGVLRGLDLGTDSTCVRGKLGTTG